MSKMEYMGTLKGHGGWVTALACPISQGSGDGVKLVSASRDKTLIAWKDLPSGDATIPSKRLEGHSGFVQDVALSSDGDYAVSASWDRSLRLWDMRTGEALHKFCGHTRDVLSVAIAPNNRQIVSGGRDNKIMVWNVVGQCMTTLDKDAHTDWVSCVRFSPVLSEASQVVSGSWDGTVKVWDMATSTCTHTLKGHTAQVTAVTVSPDSSLFATASRDGVTKLWDLRRSEHLYELAGENPIHQVCFSPNRYWLCAATSSSIRIYDLETKEAIAELVPERDATSKKSVPECTAIAWSADGNLLYSGHTDQTIRIWRVSA